MGFFGNTPRMSAQQPVPIATKAPLPQNHNEQQGIHLGHGARERLFHPGIDTGQAVRETAGHNAGLAFNMHGNGGLWHESNFPVVQTSNLSMGPPDLAIPCESSPFSDLSVLNMNSIGLNTRRHVHGIQQTQFSNGLLPVIQNNNSQSFAAPSVYWNGNEALRPYKIIDEQRQNFFMQKAMQGMTHNLVPQFQSAPSMSEFNISDPMCHHTRKRKLAPSAACNGNGGRVVKLVNHHRMLLLYHHASSCLDQGKQCFSLPCTKMKGFLSHMDVCFDVNCTMRCFKFKLLFNHYEKCRRSVCQLCSPVKLKLKHMPEFFNAVPTTKSMLYIENPEKRMNVEDTSLRRSFQNEVCQDSQLNGVSQIPVLTSTNTKLFEEMLIECQDVTTKEDGNLKADGYSQMNTVTPLSDMSAEVPLPSTQLAPEGLLIECQDATTKDGNLKAGGYSLPHSFHNGFSEINRVTPLSDMSPEMSPPSTQLAPEGLLIECKDAATKDGNLKLETEANNSSSKGSLKGSSEIEMENLCRDASQEDFKFRNTLVNSSSNNAGKPRIQGVSLIDLFTRDQVREHIRRLKQSTDHSNTELEKRCSMEQASDCNSCSLCGQGTLLFEPLSRYCELCSVQIKHKGLYYHTKGTETVSSSNGAQKYFCEKCYKASEETIKISNERIAKSELGRGWNYAKVCAQPEMWVECVKCEKRQHVICSLVNIKRYQEKLTEYICPECHLLSLDSRESTASALGKVLGAKELPTNKLSDHIEKWLLRRLEEERQERAVKLGKIFDEVPGAEGLVVRVVSSVDKTFEVKQRFHENFKQHNYPSEFPYRSKAILLFQKIEDVDVCLFVMYVHEYGSECASPNQRHVVISYLDSVKYFRPEVKTASGEALRTFVYHEILMGYLEYCKKRGFVNIYLWACPPEKGNDYILNCHPHSQKMPKSDKLRNWYHNLIMKAIKEKIAVSYTNLHSYFFDAALNFKIKVSAASLPYFDGDCWPGRAEILLEKYACCLESPDMKDERAAVERILRAAKREALLANPEDIVLMHQLGEEIKRSKEDFILIHLHYSCNLCYKPILGGKMWANDHCKNFQLCSSCHMEQSREAMDGNEVSSKAKQAFNLAEVEELAADTRDEDGTVESKLFDNRLACLGHCQENNYQFGTLRRAKHATMMILYHLHDEHKQREEQKMGSSVSAQSSNAVTQDGPLLDVLVHASECRVRDCMHPCREMKELFRHGVRCEIRSGKGCARCKMMWDLLRSHASACNKMACLVPRCKDIRKIMEDKLLQPEPPRKMPPDFGKPEEEGRKRAKLKH